MLVLSNPNCFFLPNSNCCFLPNPRLNVGFTKSKMLFLPNPKCCFYQTKLASACFQAEPDQLVILTLVLPLRQFLFH